MLALSQVGLLFNALVSGSIGVIALIFMIYLFKRWRHLDALMRAYGWFWFFTMLLWLWFSLHYVLVAFNGYGSVFLKNVDVIVQGAIFFTGPPLFYYLGLKVLHNIFFTRLFSVISCVLGFISLFFIVWPGGLTYAPITNFTADMIINRFSLGIFGGQIIVIFILLIYDIASRLYTYGLKNQSEFYEMLYSLSLLIYISLGAIDQSKIILDWPLVVFRILYASAFLFSYMVIAQDKMRHEEYFLKNSVIINTGKTA